MQNTTIFPTLLLSLFAVVSPLEAQRRPPSGGEGRSQETLDVPTESGIAWFGTWEAGLDEAKRTGRPILLMSAAPQCQGVPGMW